jgi:proteasome lid subunit RPN8/RPN11
MTDTTDLGTITVTGQRRPPDSAPSISFNGRFDSPSPQVDYEPKPGETPIDEQPHDRCADPVTALPWNADAAGAAAVNNFLAKAAEIGFADAPNGVPNLLNREFGNFLLRGTGQSIEGTPVTAGLAGSPTDLELDLHNTTPYNYQGDVHSHPFGSPLPSQADWDGFMANNRAARHAGRTGETFYMYIVAADPNGGPPTIHVYQDGPRAANSADPPKPTTKGPEVNPDAQPCP